MHVDAVLDEWLTVAADGKTHAFPYRTVELQTNSDDVAEKEQAQLEEIRNTYIPELFLDYHAALYYSARVLTSDNLVQCMNLGIQLAENEFLTRCFIASRRMRELVEALALSSKAMVNTGATPGKRLLGGESLGIWNVAVPEDGNLPGAA